MTRRVTSVSLSEDENDFLRAVGLSAGEYIKRKIAHDREHFEPKEMLEKQLCELRAQEAQIQAKISSLSQMRLDYFESGRPRHILDELFEGYRELVKRIGRQRARSEVVTGWRETDRRLTRMSSEELALYLETRVMSEEQRRLNEKLGVSVSVTQ